MNPIYRSINTICQIANDKQNLNIDMNKGGVCELFKILHECFLNSIILILGTVPPLQVSQTEQNETIHLLCLTNMQYTYTLHNFVYEVYKF